MKKYILALDEGTTSARAVIYDVEKCQIKDIVSKPFDLRYPKPGWVEHDANDVWAAQFGAMSEVIMKTNIPLNQIASIGITNQRETLVVWNCHTGEPVYNAIVWQCRRTSKFCQQLKDSPVAKVIQEKTGLICDAYFSASKLKWILDNVEGARIAANNGDLMFGTMDTWLIYKLSGGNLHVTDTSNASRTMLFNIHTLQWDDELLKIFDVPKSMMPKVIHSDQKAGMCTVLKEDIEICGIAGDQQAALFGQACFNEGSAKNTYGTGCFILLNTGNKVVESKNMLLSTIAWTINGKTTYALEGSVFNAGSSVQWLRDGLDLFKEAAESEGFALQAVDDDGRQGTNGVYVVPAFTGLGAPYWNMKARGTIVGITRNVNKYHIVRATLESMAYSTKDVLIEMEKDGAKIVELSCDGGASNNNFLMQFQSDILGISIRRPKITETTVLGAVYLSGLGSGLFKDLNEISDKWQMQRKFMPKMSVQEADNKYNGWKRAVSRSLDWEE